MSVVVLLFAGMLLGSFGVAGYLLFKTAKRLAAPSGSTNIPVEKLLARAAALLRKQQTEQALLMYRHILTSNPKSLDAQMALARAELMAGREDIAGQEYESALRLDGNNTTALLQLAQIYSHRTKTWGLAEARFGQYLVLKPGDSEARLQFARLLAWQGRWKDAAESYSTPTLARLLTIEDQRNYVVALVKSGQTERAERVLKGLLGEGRQDFELRVQLANLHASRQDWNSALPLYRSLVQERPSDARVNLTYGIGLLTVRDYRAALEPLAKARDRMPSNREAGLAYARALRGVKDYKGAEREFERVLPAYRGDRDVIREYADLLLEKRSYLKAETYYTQAYDMGLRDVRLLVSLSGTLRANRKPKAALPFLEEAYKREPTDQLALELATLMRDIGLYDQACHRRCGEQL